jgi:hypothetical protein
LRKIERYSFSDLLLTQISISQETIENLRAQISNLKERIATIENNHRKALEQATEETNLKVDYPTFLHLIKGPRSTRRMRPEGVLTPNEMGNIEIKPHQTK